MSNHFWLTEAQMAQLRPFFPKSHGKPRVDDRHNLHQSRWLVVVRCTEGVWRAEDPLRSLEAVERQRCLRLGDECSCL